MLILPALLSSRDIPELPCKRKDVLVVACLDLRRNSPEVRVTSGQKLCTKIIYRLDNQPLFGKRARAPPPNSLLGEERRHDLAAEIEPRLFTSYCKLHYDSFKYLLKKNHF